MPAKDPPMPPEITLYLPSKPPPVQIQCAAHLLLQPLYVYTHPQWLPPCTTGVSGGVAIAWTGDTTLSLFHAASPAPAPALVLNDVALDIALATSSHLGISKFCPPSSQSLSASSTDSTTGDDDSPCLGVGGGVAGVVWV